MVFYIFLLFLFCVAACRTAMSPLTSDAVFSPNRATQSVSHSNVAIDFENDVVRGGLVVGHS